MPKPLCPVFGSCGGCETQDIAYEEELKLKRASLQKLFVEDLGVSGNLFEPTVPSPEPYYYRHRLDLTLKRYKTNEIEIGFQKPGTSRLVPIDACAIARQELNAFIPELKRQAIQKLPSDYRTANLVVRTGDDGRVLWGGIGKGSLETQPKDYLWIMLRGRKIFYSLGTFFQANLSILEDVANRVEALCEFDSETVFLDLYSGVGLFGICFADQVQHVIMIEESPASCSLARYNRAYHQLDHIKVIEGKVEIELPRILKGVRPMGLTPSVVALVDPPRQGVAASALETLIQSKSLKALFYLSCSPESLARDMKAFLKNGWKIQTILPFDFFPKTKHLETLVMMKPC